MAFTSLCTDRLELRLLPVDAANALPDDREHASQYLGATLSPEWPDPHLVGILRRHAELPPGMECFGMWAMIETERACVIGDIGFHGPPDDAGTVEVGYSVIPACRRRGYATEAAGAIVAWARSQPGVGTVVAGCLPDNAPSIGTLERVGFQRTGEAGGELRWRFEPQPTG